MKSQHNIFYRIGAAFCRKILYRTKVEGLENIPEEGALILCANHTSKHDPVVIDALVGRKIQTMAKKEAFGNKFAGALIRSVGAFPVDRAGNDVAAVRYTIKLLRAGGALCIFPQGTRRPRIHPKDTPLRDGLGYFACKAKATVVPVCIQTKEMKVKAFRTTYVTFGKPFVYDEYKPEKECQEEYRALTAKFFSAVCDAMKDERTDWDKLASIKSVDHKDENTK